MRYLSESNSISENNILMNISKLVGLIVLPLPFLSDIHKQIEAFVRHEVHLSNNLFYKILLSHFKWQERKFIIYSCHMC